MDAQVDGRKPYRPPAPDEPLTAVGSPPLSRWITHCSKLPDAPLYDCAGAAGAGPAAGAAVTGCGGGAGMAAMAAWSSQSRRGCHGESRSRIPARIAFGLLILPRFTHHRAGHRLAAPYLCVAMLARLSPALTV